MKYEIILTFTYLFLPFIFGEVVLSFKDLEYTSEEIGNNPVNVVVVSSEKTVTDIFITCSLPDTAKDDFISITAASVLKSQTNRTTCIFYITDDTVPEGNKTYLVTLASRDKLIKNRLPNVTRITIYANDDPYGCIGISNKIKVISADEPEKNSIPILIYLMRYGGLIGNVSVYWEIFPRQDPTSLDINPANGYVHFAENQANYTLVVAVMPDDIPESREIYNLRLVTVTGGACLKDNEKEVEVRIEENDAPVRFSRSAVTFMEPDKEKVTVYRGIDINGKRIGPTLTEVRVFYQTIPGTAKPNLDYIPVQGEIIFEPGITQKDIEIEVLSDPFPELLEHFSVVLTKVSVGIILSQPKEIQITISKNDYPHGLISFSNSSVRYVINEDDLGSVSIPVRRTFGMFGNVTVQWEIMSDRNDPSIVFVTSVGFIIFKSNDSVQNIALMIKSNDVPSEAVGFNVSLTNASNGAELLMSATNEFPKVDLIVADSDNAYGVFNFVAEDAELILSSTPRRIKARISRTGGSFGEVVITYSVQYFHRSYNQSAASTIISTSGLLLVQRQEHEKVIVSEIKNDAFLRSGSAFVIKLENATLKKSTLIKSSSPTIGLHNLKFLNITQNLANGEIGFLNSPIYFEVDEPNITNTRINLTVMRDGSSVNAKVYWRLMSDNVFFTNEDVYPSSGFVELQKGIDKQNISFEIVMDDIPELDEVFTVQLYNTTGRNEKLHSGATSVKIKIKKNDNPGGTFEFQNTTHIFLEESSSKTTNVVRIGGCLETQQVLVVIQKGAIDFRPDRQLFVFMPGETQKTVFLFPLDDDVPELDESFDINLYSIDGSALGNKTVIKVTIQESDDPYGLIAFSNSPLNLQQTIRELTTSESKAIFQIARSKGTFGEINIFWNVSSTSNTSSDLHPLYGVVQLLESHNTGTFVIYIRQDQIPEQDELFQIRLLNVSGGAHLVEPSISTLTIISNDFPVTISPSYIHMEEGHNASLFIHLNKTFTYPVSVLVKTVSNGISENDFIGFMCNITFLAGEITKPIQVTTVDDDIPELDEAFTVQIISVTGDNVIYKDYTSHIIINANDDAHGVFTFNTALQQQVEEGNILKLRIDRLRGTFGDVRLLWRAFNATGDSVTEISAAGGFVYFNDSQDVSYIEVMVNKDNEAETNETFFMKLMNITDEMGRLGDITVVEVMILSNDYPNGIFLVDSLKTNTIFAEDFVINDDFTTKGNVTFRRKQGSFYSAEIVWEIYKYTFAPQIPNRIWDLLLHGNAANSVRQVDGRKGSAAAAYKLSAGSCVTVSPDEQPKSSDLQNGFSVGMWIKPTASAHMNLLTKSSTTGVIFSIKIDTRFVPISITVSVAVDKNNMRDFSSSLPSNHNFLDGEWHSLFIVFSQPGKITIYSDGQLIKTSSIFDLHIVTNSAGMISVGCAAIIQQHYIGSTQDVRIYPKTLLPLEITMLHELSSTFFPFNGKLLFSRDETTKSVTTTVINDDLAEPKTFYAVRIIDVYDNQSSRDRAIISDQNGTVRLEVLKSDYANGVFSLLIGTCVNNLTENSSWNVTIERTHGLYDTVTVGWEIRNMNSGAMATDDFVNATGFVYFDENEEQQIFTITAFDDVIPEQMESFSVKLTSAIPGDKQPSPTLTSGASINATLSQCQVTVLQSDYPSGILQLMDVIPSSATFIVPIKSPLHINIKEEQGTLDVFIVRAQGTQGEVRVEWKTEGISAVGGKDYQETLGSILIKSGKKSEKITIQIIDNDLPELAKTFKIFLSNPTGGAILDVGSVMYVNIKPSDNALGTFGFKQKIIETNEGTSFNIPIQRIGGSLGDVNLTWRVVNGSNDFVDSVGSVLIVAGQMDVSISLNTSDDDIPELEELFAIQIINLTGGTINKSADIIMIMIRANDHPYGLFNFKETVLKTEEQNKTVSVSINRTRGTVGHVRVFVNVGEPVNLIAAVENIDFSFTLGFVDFMNGENEKIISVAIIDDDIPEVDETFYLNITQVVVLNQTDPTLIGRQHVMHVIILSNDFANGALTFDSTAVEVTEDHVGGVVNATRDYGLFGMISFKFKVTSLSASIGADYNVNTFDVAMVDGQKFVVLPIYIVPDEIPEFNETFTVTILADTITGGAVVGDRTVCEVMILESDYPYGILGFADQSSYVLKEPTVTKQLLTLYVIREGGLFGVVQISWLLESVKSTDSALDVYPVQGHIGFLTGERRQNISFTILQDDLPEFNETFIVKLADVTVGKAKINKQKSDVSFTILPNDNPYGTVEFVNSEISALEKDTDFNVSIAVYRFGGLYADLNVFYSTVEVVSQQSAGSSDFKAVHDGAYFVIANDSPISHVNISIISDNIPELNETFQVVITRVEVVGVDVLIENQPAVGKRNIINVTIERNDYPNGIFQITLDSYHSNRSLTEPDEGSLSLQFDVERLNGLFGAVSVSWRLSPGYTITLGQDVSGVDGATLTYLPNEQQKSFTISVNSDDIPENDEQFTIELYNPTGGAIISTHNASVRLIVSANDNAGGIIGFQQGSLSKSANEGDVIKLFLLRSSPGLGTAVVGWNISGFNTTEDFVQTFGIVTFEPSTLLQQIDIEVVSDLKPEPNEEFIVELTSIKTTGISSSGAAILDESTKQAFIFLGASNDPHGVFEFSPVSQPVHVRENVGTIQFLIIRQQGKLGLVEIFYEVQLSNSSLYMANASIPGDVSVAQSSVLIQDGIDAIQLFIPVVDDNIPEIDEGFAVKLTAVVLKTTPKNSTLLPRIGKLNQLLVIIDANDGARGELSFTTASVDVTVEEYNHDFNLTVRRSLGVFGDVYCFYFLNHLTASANDFHVNGGVMNGEPGKLVFKDGQLTANITVFIKDDTITEDIERFEIGLTTQNAVGNGGVVIGKPSRTTVYILANDDAHGIFEFLPSSRNVTIEEPVDHKSQSYNFVVRRNAGRFGDIVISWKVMNASLLHDVMPLSGILHFAAYEVERSFKVSVIHDDVPELEKTLNVSLGVISGGARLGAFSTASLIIPANDYPNGLFTFTPHPKIITEESTKATKVTVVRQGGLYGKVTVNFHTIAGTAKYYPGSASIFNINYVFNIENMKCSHVFQAFNDYYVILSSGQHLRLYVWKGTFREMKDYPINGIMKISSLDVDDSEHKYLILSNMTSVNIYQFDQNQTLLLHQQIQAFKISDVLIFNIDNRDFLAFLIAIDENNESIQLLQLYQKNGNTFIKQTSALQTFYGQTLDFIKFKNNGYLVVGNKYNNITQTHNTKSVVYQWTGSQTFTVYGEIPTNAVNQLKFFNIMNELVVGVANDMGTCMLYAHDKDISGRFYLKQNFLTFCNGIEMITHENQVILLLFGDSPHVFHLDEQANTFVSKESVTPFEVIQYASTIHLPSFKDDEQILFIIMYSNSSHETVLTQFVNFNGSSDYISRNGHLVFDEHQKELELYFEILSDSVPEQDEIFYVELSNATHGASITKENNLEILIMANDNAYGRIEICNSSLHNNVLEESHDTLIHIPLKRLFGSYGTVDVFYNVTRKQGDLVQKKIYPDNGKIRFQPGEVSKMLILYLRSDNVPDLAEDFEIRLTGIKTLDVSTKGATINYMQNTAVITILPNDHPYGVFGWRNEVQVTTEETEVNATVLLVIRREKGVYADVQISYETFLATKVGLKERPAQPYIDFSPTNDSVIITEGEREVFVFINISHDGNIDFNEIFYVKLTKVQLLSKAPLSSVAPPALKANGTAIQVVITEVVQQNGVLSFQSSDAIIIDESIGILQIPVIRTKGADATVGAFFQIVYGSATNTDVLPQKGTLTFSANETRKMISLNINNDDIPELAESFTVVLTKPVGGAVIGHMNRVNVTIIANDYPYGLFGIPVTTNHLEFFEGDSAIIPIQRQHGSYNQVSVFWNCEKKSVFDITPISGSVTFEQGQTRKYIRFSIIDDILPEVDEMFTCQITNVTNLASLSNETNVEVKIKASDKPYGVFRIGDKYRRIAVQEPTSDYLGNFSIVVEREVGIQGSVEVLWNISTCQNDVNNMIETFSKISGIVVFNSGEAAKTIHLHIFDDFIPEAAQTYILCLYNATNGGELNSQINMTQTYITVAASDNPYGIFTIDGKKPKIVNEDVGSLNVIVKRNKGLIGSITIQYNISSVNATHEKDYFPSSGELVFHNGDGFKSITLNILNDNQPELVEVLTVELVSATLNKAIDFDQTINKIQINTPPLIDPASATIDVIISENDYPYGIIEFPQSVTMLHESQTFTSIPVVRHGGLYGSSDILFTYTQISATINSDFMINTTSLSFSAGQNVSYIPLQLINDVIPEGKETFDLHLQSVVGRAILGNVTDMTVVIETSDNPHGLLGLYNVSKEIRIQNPLLPFLLNFTVTRMAGNSGLAQVTWEICRAVSSASHVTEDLTPSTGSLNFNNGQSGYVVAQVTALPYGGPQEKEEKFTFSLVSASGGATIDDSVSTVDIIIEKKGYPAGLFSLFSQIIPSSHVGEPEQGDVSIQIPIHRSFGRIGDVNVVWKVQSVSGNVTQDITYHTPNVINFKDQQSNGYIVINITADDEPELDEEFVVSLVSTDSSSDIDERKKHVTFIIMGNDHPYGVFKLPSTGQIFHLNSSTLERSIQVTVDREAGLLGTVIASISLEHDDNIPLVHTLMFSPSQVTSSVTVILADQAYLSYGTTYVIRLTAVTLAGNASTSVKPVLAKTSISVSVSLPEEACNAIVQVNNQSLYVPVDMNTNMAYITLIRVGLYGTITIPWSSGYPVVVVNKPYMTIGTMVPSSGTVTIPHNKKSETFNVKMDVRSVVTSAQQYVLYLNENLIPSRSQKAWPKLGKNIHTVIEPHGIVRIAEESEQVLVLEGQSVDIMIERIFSTIGAIRVRYQTKMHVGLDAAVPDEDYTPMTSYIDFSEGEFRKFVRISTLDEKSNPKPEFEEIFFFELSSVEVLTTRLSVFPRLSLNITSRITIQDNDDPFGIISFKSRAVSADESAMFVELDIQRTGGTFSTSTVQVITIGGGESWSSSIENSLDPNSAVFKFLQGRPNAATSGYDYDPISSAITFSKTSNSPVGGQTRKVQLRILQDNIPEPLETVIVILLNTTGGAKLFNPHAYAVVSLRENGLYNGEIGFQRRTAILDEDGAGSVVLTVVRTGEALQEVTINWLANTPFDMNLAEQLATTSGRTTLPAGASKTTILLKAIQDTIPEFASYFFVNLTSVSSGAIIKQSDSVVNVTLSESDYPVGLIGFDEQSRYIVLQLGDGNLQLTIQRYNGSLRSTTVKFETVSLPGMVLDGGLQLNPAIEGRDYERVEGTLKFEVGQTEAFINVKFSTTAPSTETSYPRLFNVTLNGPTNGAVLYQRYKFARIIISMPGTTSQFLKLRSSTLNLPLTDKQILDILNGLLVSIRSSQLSANDQQLIKNTVHDILLFKSSLEPGSKSLTSQSKAVLLDIFNQLMDGSRSDTRGNSYWSTLLEQSVYHFLNDAICPTTISDSRSNFHVEARRGNGSELNGALFKSGSDFFRYPVNIFSSSDVQETCADVHFIIMNNHQWFSSQKTVLNNKVLSSAIQTGLGSTNNKIVYRVHAPSNRITPTGVTCVIWTHPTSTSVSGLWSSSNCQVVSETKTYIECECNHLSEYAVLGGSDDRTGYEIYFYVACFITLGSCLLALLSHHCCAMEKTFTSNLLMHIFFSVMMTNLIYVIAGYVSPKLLDHTERCSILALSIHYFFLTQFTNMFVQGCNLWRILILNDEHSYRKAIPFFLLGWGFPVLIIIAYVFVTHAVWGWEFTKMYGDVHGNGDMCFIAHAYAAFSVAVIPVLLIILALCVVFVQAYQVTPQWKYYDDVYRGRYNIKEVRHVLIVFGLIVLTWLFGGLHMTYGSLWMVIAFTSFNVFLGLYILVVYVILRNQMRYIFQGKYHIQQAPSERLEMPNMVYNGVDSTKQAKKTYAFNNPIDLNEWGNVEVSRITPQLYHSPTSEKNRYTDTFNTPTSYRRHGNNIDSYDDDDSADFDDLIFALKSGGRYTSSIHEEDKEEQVDLPPTSSASEQYTVRRIKIGDTHL